MRHPYLQALGDGTLPDTRFALHDFAKHYYGYSAHFPLLAITDFGLTSAVLGDYDKRTRLAERGADSEPG